LQCRRLRHDPGRRGDLRVGGVDLGAAIRRHRRGSAPAFVVRESEVTLPSASSSPHAAVVAASAIHKPTAAVRAAFVTRLPIDCSVSGA
jgi:hypothetical protein